VASDGRSSCIQEIKTTDGILRKAKLASQSIVMKANAMSSCPSFTRLLLGAGSKNAFLALECSTNVSAEWFLIRPRFKPCLEALIVDVDDTIQGSQGALL
jgi:hypothetical protein